MQMRSFLWLSFGIVVASTLGGLRWSRAQTPPPPSPNLRGLTAILHAMEQRLAALEQKQTAIEQTLQASQRRTESTLQTIQHDLSYLREWIEYGRLRIEGQPAGAVVKLDGQIQGTLAGVGQPPLVVKIKRHLRHSLTVEKDRFFPAHKTILLTEALGEIGISLIPATIRLTIDSQPSGASVFFDQRKVGVTPFSTDVLKGSRIRLSIQKEGFPRHEEDLAVSKTPDRPLFRQITLYAPGQRLPIRDLPDAFARFVPKGSFLRAGKTIQITKGLWVFETEVTQAQYKTLIGSDPPQLAFKDCGPTCPVERISWHEAAIFADRLSQKHGLEGCFSCTNDGDSFTCHAKDHSRYTSCRGWRLPTEAEWEYSARAGQADRYGSIDEIAWYWNNSRNRTRPVRQKKPNPFGLYDMFGNVWEWCYDWFGPFPSTEEADPSGPLHGSARVYRGGGWLSNAQSVHPAYRSNWGPTARDYDLGFRLVRLAE